MLRDADELLLPEVKRTIAALETTQRDVAAERLAERYAALIDSHKDPAWALRWIGPLLLDSLESLGATPAARGKLREGTASGGGTSLARLRAARRA